MEKWLIKIGNILEKHGQIIIAIISAIALIEAAWISSHCGPVDCDECIQKCTCLTSIDKMESSSIWTPNNDRNSSMQNPTNVPGKINNAVNISYNISNNGYAGIEKHLTSGSLANIKGLKLFYKGSGEPNTLEINLKETNGPVFGYSCNRATNTNDVWTPLDIPISHFRLLKCDGGPLCENKLDLGKVDTIEFYVSNKPKEGDISGKGHVVIDEVDVRTC